MIRILVVDDNEDHAADIVDELTCEDLHIDTANSASSAIALIRDNDAYDVVVTDLFMESNTEKDGFSVVKFARDKSDSTKVIVITSQGTPEISVHSMRIGAFDYVERDVAEPFLERLNLAIQKAIA